LPKHGRLKNISLAYVPLRIKDKVFKTFSKAHINKKAPRPWGF